MKKCFGVLVLTLLFFGSCQQGIRSPSEATTTETSLETSETAPFTITEVIPETTNVIRESTNEYPHWRVEHEQYISQEVKDNMAIIQEVLFELDFPGRWHAYELSHSIAAAFVKIGVTEIKEGKVLERNENADGGIGYLVRFVDVNDNAYRIPVGTRYSTFGVIYKEGEEMPIWPPRR